MACGVLRCQSNPGSPEDRRILRPGLALFAFCLQQNVLATTPDHPFHIENYGTRKISDAALPLRTCTNTPNLRKFHDQIERWQSGKLVHLLTDMISCPGGDFCALANARSIPVAEAIAERYQDLDELDDIGEIDLHISGCINSCGHHHSGHIGILGVDKDGKEWYQVTLGGSDGSAASGSAQPGKVIGPSFSALEVPEVIEAVLSTYLDLRADRGAKRESFIEAVRRVGLDPFKTAADRVRRHTEKLA
jgi:dissimilatory sulfite reductase (desulfoviridin) alpha/beta subunit